jgi:hypothetical protein
MIAANELRIGNWIEAVAPMGNYYMKMYSVNFESLENNPDSANPIPLTPELLEKCGFIKKDPIVDSKYASTEYELDISAKIKGENRQLFVGTVLNINIPSHKKGYCFVSHTVDNYWGSNNITHLHQLQNLYFALTGEELEVNL